MDSVATIVVIYWLFLFRSNEISLLVSKKEKKKKRRRYKSLNVLDGADDASGSQAALSKTCQLFSFLSFSICEFSKYFDSNANKMK
jgi:hypothetical protein